MLVAPDVASGKTGLEAVLTGPLGGGFAGMTQGFVAPVSRSSWRAAALSGA